MGAGTSKCMITKKRQRVVGGLSISARECGENYCIKFFGKDDAYLSLLCI